MKTIKCNISGKVQGVGFRWSTKQKARKLDITGHAKNLDNGTVEVVAHGSKGSLDKLTNWLSNKGPRFAKIDNISCDELEVDDRPNSFETL